MNAARLTVVVVLAARGLSARAQGAHIVNESDGTAGYDYAFSLPAARGRYQPSLKLLYRSDNAANTGYGRGWTLSGSHIDMTGSGPTAQYWFVRDDYRQLLFASPRDGSGHYNVDVESGPMDFYQPPAGGWAARDVVGNLYTFTDPTGSGTQWYLAQVTDPDQNVTVYTYDSTPLLTTLKYNNYDPSNPTSTAAIQDTSHFATEVDLEYTAFGGTSVLINVRVKNQGSLGQLTVRRYSLSQVVDSTFGTSADGIFLESITEFGGENSLARPPTSFGHYGVASPTTGCLRSVVTPLGAQYVLTYAASTQFADAPAHSYAVVTAVAISGPALAGNTVQYWYAAPTWGTDSSAAQEFRGFAQSWAQDSVTSTVIHTWWEVYSHAFVGWPALVDWGVPTSGGSPTQPPSYSPFRREQQSHSARNIGASTCTPVSTDGNGVTTATEVAAVSYPVTVFTTLSKRTKIADGLSMSSQTSVACADVDGWGNVHKRSVDPDTGAAGDEHVETSTYS